MSLVSTWADAVAVVEKSYTLAMRETSWVGFVNGGLKVKVMRFEALGQPYVAITTELGGAQMAAGTALELNHRLPLGAIERDGEVLLLRLTLPLDGLKADYLRSALTHVCNEGKRLQQPKRDVALAPFLHFSE